MFEANWREKPKLLLEFIELLDAEKGFRPQEAVGRETFRFRWCLKSQYTSNFRVQRRKKRKMPIEEKLFCAWKKARETRESGREKSRESSFVSGKSESREKM